MNSLIGEVSVEKMNCPLHWKAANYHRLFITPPVVHSLHEYEFPMYWIMLIGFYTWILLSINTFFINQSVFLCVLKALLVTNWGMLGQIKDRWIILKIGRALIRFANLILCQTLCATRKIASHSSPGGRFNLFIWLHCPPT